jgi:hypothetical protein
MSFFTSAQLFGDNAGYGTQVPISMSNPAGYGAANRGIGFGEQLSSAIANRSHYALGLNTDDLNTRLALFETGGLDAAYDQGVVAVAGGGRVITKDGGAVETQSSLAAMFADDIANAHFRANAMGDVVPGGGFDFKGTRETVDPAYGFLARVNSVAALVNSNISYLEAATLNPGGLGTDLLRFTSATAYTSTDTDVQLDFDMVEISGASVGVNGLYYIHTFGPAASDFHLRKIDGSSPTFGSGVAVSVRLFRASFMSPANMPSGGFGAMVAAVEGNQAALAIFTHDYNGYLGTGTDKAIEFHARTKTGANLTAGSITGLAQLRSSLSSAYLDVNADVEMRLLGGIANMIFDHSGAAAGSHEAGLIFKDSLNAVTSRAAAENWQRITETTVLGINPSINGTFASPAGRILLPDSDGTPAAPTGQLKWVWPLVLVPGVTVVEMLTGSNAGQFYLLNRCTLTGASSVDPVADEFRVTDLDGGTPILPTSGAFTFRFLGRDMFGFKMPASQLKSSPDPVVVANDPVSYGHVFGQSTTTATRKRGAGFTGALAGFSVDQTAAAGDLYLQENWFLDIDGEFRTKGRIHTAGLTLTTDPVITIPETDTDIHLDLSLGQSEEDAAGAPYWRWDRTNQRWELITLGGGGDSALYIPITFSGVLRFTTVQAFASSGSSHSVLAALRITAPAWGTPGTPPTVTNANEATIVLGNGVWGENFITHGGGGTTVSHETAGYAIRIRGQRVGDRLQAVKCQVRYGEIGPGGMGT